jgi:hypothetical protein
MTPADVDALIARLLDPVESRAALGVPIAEDALYIEAAAALAALTAENESLRAECGLRQIRGYNEGKAKAEAALRMGEPREKI